MDKTLLFDLCIVEQGPIVNTPTLKIGKVDLYYTPAVIGEQVDVSDRTKRKAIYVDSGNGRDYILTQNGKRRLISEVPKVYGVYIMRGETPLESNKIVKQLKEDINLDSIFEE